RLISLIALTGQRSTPRRLRRQRQFAVAERGAGNGCLSGGRYVASSGDSASSNPAFAISRGSLDASPLTPEHDRRFADMRLFRSPFGSGLAIGPKNLSFEFLPAEPGIQQGASRRDGAHTDTRSAP